MVIFNVKFVNILHPFYYRR